KACHEPVVCGICGRFLQCLGGDDLVGSGEAAWVKNRQRDTGGVDVAGADEFRELGQRFDDVDHNQCGSGVGRRRLFVDSRFKIGCEQPGKLIIARQPAQYDDDVPIGVLVEGGGGVRGVGRPVAGNGGAAAESFLEGAQNPGLFLVLGGGAEDDEKG